MCASNRSSTRLQRKKKIDRARKAPSKQREKKIKRDRKAPIQLAALWKLYDQYEGKPDHETIASAAFEYSLTKDQIYKWFWDTRKKKEQKKNQNGSEDKCQQQEG